VADKVGVDIEAVNFATEYKDRVFADFLREYSAGRTPNPCVLCNTHIKWNALLKRADALDCEFIATGHYARIKEADGRKFISKSADDNKDQSYVLWGLTQEALKRSRFPLGHLTKPEVRKVAFDAGYAELSKKAESYEICFVPDNDYRGFLKRRRPELEAEVAGGNFVNTKGEILGKHQGYPFYTIGQRKGLGKAFGEPMFVNKIDPETNTVVLGTLDELVRNGMTVYQANIQKYDRLPDGLEALTKVRYHDRGTLGKLSTLPDGKISVEFMANVSGVAPGQSAVFYEGDDVVGGGIIHSSLLLQ
jgi:tRNA-specific 2-thiouridylase